MFLLAILGMAGVGFAIDAMVDDDSSDADQTSETAQVDDQETSSAENEVSDDDDEIIAGASNDFIAVGNGDDTVLGGNGVDVIFGEAGDDFLRGGDGEDVLVGGAGNDELFGDASDDVLFGADIFDEDGITTLLGTGQLPDDLFELENETGEADTLRGGQGEDMIMAGGNDVVETGNGADIVNAGIWIAEGTHITVQDFNTDQDALLYSYETGGTAPTITFTEDDEGNAEVRADDTVFAVLEDVNFTTLNTSHVTFEQINFAL